MQTVWCYISLYFGKRGRENQRAMKKTMLRLCVTGAGEEYFELKKDQPGTMLSSKNHTGGLEGTEDHSDGKIFAISSSPRCPVKTIKSYLSHLNPDNDQDLHQQSLTQMKPWFGTRNASLVTTHLTTCCETCRKELVSALITPIIRFEPPLSPFYHPKMLKHGKSKLLLVTGAIQVSKVIVKGQLSASSSRCHQR